MCQVGMQRTGLLPLPPQKRATPASDATVLTHTHTHKTTAHITKVFTSIGRGDTASVVRSVGDGSFYGNTAAHHGCDEILKVLCENGADF